MSLKSEAIKRFLTAAKSLADQGLSKEAIIQFAKNEFGQINELFQKQIDNIFKPKKGIENIKIKDEVFDDTVIKLPVDDTGQPFNPRNPMKEYGKIRYRKPEEFDTRKQYEEYLDSVLGPADDVFGNPLKDDLLAEFDKVKAKNVTPSQGFDISKDPPKGFQTEKFIRDFPVTREEAERIAKLPNEERKKILQQYIDEDTNRQLTLLEYDVTDRKPNAKGGIAEFYTGGMVDVEPSLSDIGHGSDALMARTRLMSPGAQATTSTGLNYLLAEDNDNIRVPFAGGGSDRMMSDAEKEERAYNLMRDAMDREKFLKRRREEMEMDKKRLEEKKYGIAVAEGGRIGFSKGKLADAARRKFMKIAGGIGAGITGLKTGLLGFGKEAAPVVEKTVETITETAQNVPPYFLNLVNKIKNLGTKFKGPTERSESYRFKDYEMDVELDTGKIDIKKTKEAMIPGGDEAGIAEEVYMTYKPGMADEATGGKKVVDEYDEFTARPDIDGKMKDVEDGVPDEVIEEGTVFEDNMTEFGKASGGIARMLGE